MASVGDTQSIKTAPVPSSPLHTPSADEVLAQARKGRRSPLVLGVAIAIAIIAHVIGWQVTGLNLGNLWRDAPKMGRIVSQLIHPDVFTQDQAAMRAYGDVPGLAQADASIAPSTNTLQAQPLFLVADQDPIPLTGTVASAVNFTVSPGSVAPGQMVQITGKFDLPSQYSGAKSGRIVWQHVGGAAKELAFFNTDSNGNFTTTFQVPDASQTVGDNKILVEANWGVGGLRFSQTLIDTVGRVIETIFLALMGTTLAVVLSIPVAFLASRNIMPHNLWGNTLYYGARTVLNLLRSIEALILATIFVAAVGIGSPAGVLALIVHSIASLGKLYSEAIEGIDPGPIEAITATGAGRLSTIVFAVVPQFIPQFIAFTLYRWDINVRMSTILGLVGGGGIGYLLTQYINLLDWSKAGTAIWTIALVVVAIDIASARIRQAVI